MRLLSLLVPSAALVAAACAPMPPSEGPGGADPVAQTCPASKYARYIGRNRTELPPQPAGENWRVTCTTCPVTMDYRGDRVNILYEERTGVIREVKCG